MMKFEPLNDRILIKQDEEKYMKGGIHLLPGTVEKPQMGTIEAAHATSQLKEGERVLFGKYSGTKVTIDNVEYIIMKEEDLLGVFHE